MNDYMVTLKLEVELIADIKADDLQAALEEAKALYTDNIEKVVTLKARKTAYINYSSLQVTGVQG